MKQNQITQEKMKSLKGTNNFLLIIGVMILFIAPLIHIEFDKKNHKVEAYKAKVNKQILKPIEESLKTLRLGYEQRKISAENYITNKDKLDLKLLKAQQEYKKLVEIEKNKNRVFGWLTTRKFLIGFGIRFPYLLFSLIISYLISLINTKDKSLKRAFTFLQLALYTISGYVIIWCFWYSQDYPLSSYRFVAILLSALVSFLLYYFIRYTRVSLYAKNYKLKHIIRMLFDFILVDSKQEDFIKEEKKAYYKQRSTELVKNALDNE